MNKRFLVIAAALAAVLLASGCASVEPEQFQALQAQVYANSRQVREVKGQVEQSRRPQAELVAEMDSMRQEVSRLRGMVEEASHMMGQMPESMARMEAGSKENLEQIEARLSRVEAYLGMKPADKASQEPGGQKAAPPPPPKPKPKTAASVYELGHRLYKKKSYKAARDRFQEMLGKFPKSRLAASAHYWIGETYYAQKRYEEAILAYNQVIKRYPKSGKVPSALLKQGLSFSRLGDKRTAKIVLNKLVRNHPKSRQAKSARKLLKKMK